MSEPYNSQHARSVCVSLRAFSLKMQKSQELENEYFFQIEMTAKDLLVQK